MRRIRNTIFIDRPVEQVFEYATTPANWPAWHASVLNISGELDHSLDRGESVSEEFRVAGRKGRAVWTVQERTAAHHWIIVGAIAGGGHSRITYSVEPHSQGTIFAREVVYTLPPLLTIADRLILRPRMHAEAEKSLRKLKEVLEQVPAAHI